MEKLSLISVRQALACPTHHQLLQEQGMLSFSPLILMNQFPLLKWSAWFVQITTRVNTKKMPSYSHQISNYMSKSLGADYGQLSKKSSIYEETQGFRKLLRSKIGSLFFNQSFKFCLHFTNFSHVQNTLRLGTFFVRVVSAVVCFSWLGLVPFSTIISYMTVEKCHSIPFSSYKQNKIRVISLLLFYWLHEKTVPKISSP